MTECEHDQFDWLEELSSQRVDAWVSNQNAKTLNRISNDPRWHSVESELREQANRSDTLSVPFGFAVKGGYLYRVATSNDNPRGRIVRVPMKDFVRQQPNWETLLDLDELAEKEDQPWAHSILQFHLEPMSERCLIGLARGGSDAAEFREFSLKTKTFVPEGFFVPAAKTWICWLDADHAIIATALKEEEATVAGYPRLVRLWSRGSQLQDAPVIAAGEVKDFGVFPRRYQSKNDIHVIISRCMTMHEMVHYHVDQNQNVTKLELPKRLGIGMDPFVGVVEGRAILVLGENWNFGGIIYPEGALIAVPLASMLEAEGKPQSVELIYAPRPTETIPILGATSCAGGAVIICKMDDVVGKVTQATFDGRGWICSDIPSAEIGTFSALNFDDSDDGPALVSYTSFVVPPEIYAVEEAQLDGPLLKEEPILDSSDYETLQHFAKAKDGTLVPWFLVRPKDHNGADTPCILTAYGGFQIPMAPSNDLPYMGHLQPAWLRRGGALLVACARGGGEYGPSWHQAAIRQNRETVYSDVYACAEDAIARGYVSSRRLGAMNGSNGGLTVSVCAVQRPDLIRAGVSVCGLSDMLRFPLLHAGASWISEYGDPEKPTDRAILRRYSPFHNIEANKKTAHLFLLTSTSDDRVHPGHARKTAAKLAEYGHAVTFYETSEGGHYLGIRPEDRARTWALELIFLMQELMD